MKVSTYKEYSKVYDFFSNEILFPQCIRFIEKVSEYVLPQDKVTDVGGGTGYFTDRLINIKPDINITFVEPSREMINLAKKRLPHKTIFLNQFFDEVLNCLSAQDIFIFQRSLYSFYYNISDYRELAKRLYDITKPDVHIAIDEVEGEYDIKQMYDYLKHNIHILGVNENEFSSNWEIFEKVLLEFNNNVSKGIFYVFEDNELIDIFSDAGFLPIFHENSIFIFKK